MSPWRVPVFVTAVILLEKIYFQWATTVSAQLDAFKGFFLYISYSTIVRVYATTFIRFRYDDHFTNCFVCFSYPWPKESQTFKLQFDLNYEMQMIKTKIMENRYENSISTMWQMKMHQHFGFGIFFMQLLHNVDDFPQPQLPTSFPRRHFQFIFPSHSLNWIAWMHN